MDQGEDEEQNGSLEDELKAHVTIESSGQWRLVSAIHIHA